MLLLFACLISGAALGSAGVMFSADVRVLVTNGYYESKMYYYYSEEEQYVRYDYTSPVAMTEVINYNRKIKYKIASKCESSYHASLAPILFNESGDISTSAVDEDGCRRYLPANAMSVDAIWYKEDGTLCKAELADGKTLVFTNINTTFNNKTYFSVSSICSHAMDIVFVIDMSGSVGSSNWNNKIKPFMKDIISSLDVGADGAMIGFVTYGSTARKVFDLSSNMTYINEAIDSTSYTGGDTCTGCGINMGVSVLNNTDTHRTALNPEKIMIIMTDGYNTQYQGTPCVDYTTKCTQYDYSKCISKECSVPYRTVNTNVCKAYGQTSVCKRHICESCENDLWGSVCISKTCTKYNTSSCAKRDTTYCIAAYPSGCTIKNGVITSTYYSNSSKCLCSQYKCVEYECLTYKCNEYTCRACTKNSTACAEYEEKCVEYETTQICDGTETCTEYECVAGEAVCNKTHESDAAMLTGAITLTRTPWALYPASTRLPTVISIGVGSVSTNEVNAIASTVNGKTLSIFTSSFSYISTIIQDTIDDIYLSSIAEGESCPERCHGICGPNSTCHCPGCVPTADPLHMIAYCNENTGECIAEDILYTITFDVRDGMSTTKEYKFNETIEYPAVSDRVGFRFIGWDRNITLMPDGNITTKGLWEEFTSDSLVITFGNKDISEEEAKNIINKYSSGTFTIERFYTDNEAGEAIVIIKFDSLEAANEFVRTVAESSDTPSNFISRVNYLTDISFSCPYGIGLLHYLAYLFALY